MNIVDIKNEVANHEFCSNNNNENLIKNFLSFNLNPFSNYSENLITDSNMDYKINDILNDYNENDNLEWNFDVEGKIDLANLEKDIFNELKDTNYLNNINDEEDICDQIKDFFDNMLLCEIYNKNVINLVYFEKNDLKIKLIDNLKEIKFNYENNNKLKYLNIDIYNLINKYNYNFKEKIDFFEELIYIKEINYEIVKKEKNNNTNEKLENNEKNNLIRKENKDEAKLVDIPVDLKIVEEFFKEREFAKKYSFKLDDFQIRSFYHIEKKENVFVSAHTSAGKTCVAEYAISKSFLTKSRTIYTSPIKALSNQKFKEFSLIYNDVGIITGDICYNPNAKCLIMTTEILRNMLFNQSEKIWDVEWIIFDEIHYINNEERGVVWEETIIMLPKHINLIMLSASVENVSEFINWVVKTTNKSIYLQKTEKRPVPLKFELFYNKLILLKEGENNFNQKLYLEFLKDIKNEYKKKLKKKIELKSKLQETKAKLMQLSNQKERIRKITGKRLKSQNSKFILKNNLKKEKGSNYNDRNISSLINLIEKLKKQESLPLIIFDFSKKNIDNLSINLMPHVNLINKTERANIRKIFNLAMKTVTIKDEKNVPQILNLKEMLDKGIAVHHSDLLNICKELVEILFSKGLIKILIATDSFAMGLNMPSKTVIFKKLKKFDGNTLRFINGGEIMQMSGRAGRRGIDTSGRAIIFIGEENELPENATLNNLLNSKGERIESKFRITYSSLINYLGSNNFSIENILKKSLGNSTELNKYNELKLKYNKIEKELLIEKEKFNDKYYQKNEKENPLEIFLKEIKNKQDLNIFNNNEINKLKSKNIYGYFYLEEKIIPFKYSNKNINNKKFINNHIFVNFVLPFGIEFKEFEDYNRRNLKKINLNENNYFLYENFSLNLKYVFILFNYDSKDKETEILYNLMNQFKHDIQFNVIENVMKKIKYSEVNRKNFIKDFEYIFDFLNKQDYKVNDLLYDYNNITKINNKFKIIKRDLDANKKLFKIDECESKIEILKDLDYITKEMFPLLKLKVAKLIKGSSESLIITEILINGLLNNLNSNEIPAFFSVILDRRKNGETLIIEDLNIDENLKINLFELENIYFKLNVLEEKYDIERTNNFNYVFVENIVKWCKGYNLAEIISEENNDILEGAFSRMILRVEQLLTKILEVLNFLNQEDIKNKITKSLMKIRKGIIFNKSLYFDLKFIKL